MLCMFVETIILVVLIQVSVIHKKTKYILSFLFSYQFMMIRILDVYRIFNTKLKISLDSKVSFP